MSFYIYILRCSDGLYYVGHTDNLEQRITQHQTGAYKGFTAKRLPVTLAWAYCFATRDEAFVAERKIKGWSRVKKEALMNGDWNTVASLSKNKE